MLPSNGSDSLVYKPMLNPYRRILGKKSKMGDLHRERSPRKNQSKALYQFVYDSVLWIFPPEFVLWFQKLAYIFGQSGILPIILTYAI